MRLQILMYGRLQQMYFILTDVYRGCRFNKRRDQSNQDTCYFKNDKREMIKIIHPRAVVPIKLHNKIIPDKSLQAFSVLPLYSLLFVWDHFINA